MTISPPKPAPPKPAPPTSAPSATPSLASQASTPMPVAEAFVAVALAAVSWDGTLTAAGTRALRHAIDYRTPYRDLGDTQVALLINGLLERLRQDGAQHLMLEAGQCLSPDLRRSAYAVAAEIMRSDGELQPDERNILSTLAATLELDAAVTDPVLEVMEVLHAPVL